MKKYLVFLLMVTVLVPGLIFAVTSATVTVDTVVSDSLVNEQGADVGFWGGLFDRLKSFVTGFGLFKNTQPVVEEKQAENSGDVVKDTSSQDAETANKVVAKTGGNINPNGQPSTVSVKTNVTNQPVNTVSNQVKNITTSTKVNPVASTKPVSNKITFTSPVDGGSIDVDKDSLTINWEYVGFSPNTEVYLDLLDVGPGMGGTPCRIGGPFSLSKKTYTVKPGEYICLNGRSGPEPLTDSDYSPSLYIDNGSLGGYMGDSVTHIKGPLPKFTWVETNLNSSTQAEGIVIFKYYNMNLKDKGFSDGFTVDILDKSGQVVCTYPTKNFYEGIKEGDDILVGVGGYLCKNGLDEGDYKVRLHSDGAGPYGSLLNGESPFFHLSKNN
jgi:hypothetical protein